MLVNTRMKKNKYYKMFQTKKNESKTEINQFIMNTNL